MMDLDGTLDGFRLVLDGVWRDFAWILHGFCMVFDGFWMV